MNHPSYHAPRPAPVSIPNERVRGIIRDVAESVINYETSRSMSMARTQADEVAMATFRGAFVALRQSEDPATADFARATLVQVNVGGVQAVRTLLDKFAPPATVAEAA